MESEGHSSLCRTYYSHYGNHLISCSHRAMWAINHLVSCSQIWNKAAKKGGMYACVQWGPPVVVPSFTVEAINNQH